jgi:release factor glutamine methyltransferase
MGEYVPMMSAADVDRVTRWHERAIAGMTAAAGSDGQTFSYLGRTIAVPPQVQPIAPVSHLLGEAVLAEVRQSDRVLDMGTGSGVNAILAAATAREVVAVDVNPYAIAAAQDNAARNGVAERVTVRASDVFEAVDGRFDLIIFDPPFRWFTPRNHLEMGSADPNYTAMRRFFEQAREHLTDGGRMLIFFGTSGDLAYLHSLMDRAGFSRTTVAHLATQHDGVPVEYFTYRLT